MNMILHPANALILLTVCSSRKFEEDPVSNDISFSPYFSFLLSKVVVTATEW